MSKRTRFLIFFEDVFATNGFLVRVSENVH